MRGFSNSARKLSTSDICRSRCYHWRGICQIVSSTLNSGRILQGALKFVF